MSLARAIRGAEALVFFTIYRSLHLWQNAGRSFRDLTSPGQELWWSNFGFFWRYASLVPSIWLTVLTIQATLREDRAAETRLILWGLIPAAFRTFVSLWTSTIDRQRAYDASIRHVGVVLAITDLRLGAGQPVEHRSLIARCGRGARKAVRSAGSEFFDMRYTVKVASRKLRLWKLLAKGIEIPLNYIVQKALIVALLLLFVFPDALPRSWSTPLAVVSRWARIITMIILAPLNHFLGRLRVAAHADIERRMHDRGVSALAALASEAKGVSASISRSRKRRAERLPDSVRERAQAIADALAAPAAYHDAMRAQMEALGDRGLDIFERCGDDRETDALLRDTWRAHHRLKLYRAGLLDLERVLRAQPSWRIVAAAVDEWRRDGVVAASPVRTPVGIRLAQDEDSPSALSSLRNSTLVPSNQSSYDSSSEEMP
eukprot:Amastigsp_a509291_42.p1 type:complete len:431 gc:universal Amastigsp_a509291_42:1298-6(-)